MNDLDRIRDDARRLAEHQLAEAADLLAEATMKMASAAQTAGVLAPDRAEIAIRAVERTATTIELLAADCPAVANMVTTAGDLVSSSQPTVVEHATAAVRRARSVRG